MSYNLIEVGNTRKAVGFEGALRLEIDPRYVDDVIQAEAIFILSGYEILPFFPKWTKQEDLILVQFDDVLNREEATALAGKPVYLRKEEVSTTSSTVGEGLGDFQELLGLTVYDQNYQMIGDIKEIVSFPQQEMLMVSYQGKEVMIPLHPELILEFVPEEGIYMQLPEGILDI